MKNILNLTSVYEVTEMSQIAELYADWQETMIWSCLQGHMGDAFAAGSDQPESAQIVIADFCFFAGKPNRDLIINRPKGQEERFLILVPQHEGWEHLIEDVYGDKAVRRQRYALKKEPDIFNPSKLRNFVNQLSSNFRLELIHEPLYHQIMEHEWSSDLCSQFKDDQDYKERGIGVAVLEGETIISGASSYTVYNNGIEIEIDTREDRRRQGLALVCGAKLILECIDRGLYPSWDAHNPGSLKLAEKLGYHFNKEYPVYEVGGL